MITVSRLRITLLLLLPVLVCCSSQRTILGDVNEWKEQLLQTDKDFSRMSALQGMRTAFIAFAADDVIKMREGQHPLIGIEELKAGLPENPKRPFTLEWQPTKADVAASGDLGYTYGTWILRMKTIEDKDTVLYGNYVSIWRRQVDGRWKYVLDGGNETPKPGR